MFGEQRRLQPMAADQKGRWKKEIDWLLSVTDHIVEFVPSQQVSENGTCMEVRNPHFQCFLYYSASLSQFNYPAVRHCFNSTALN